MKRFLASVLAAAIAAFMFSACGESTEEKAPVSSAALLNSSLESKDESKAASSLASSPKSESSQAESGVSEALTADNSTEIPETDIVFDESCAFLGNSILGDLADYELVDCADVYSYVGMTVVNVFDQKLDNHEKPLLEEMLSKDYKNIFIMFGMNELGWSYHEIFYDDYAELIDEIHQALPEAKIYLLSVTPITKALEEKGEDGLNSEAISDLNTLIKKLAAEYEASCLDVGAYLKNKDGYLDEDDSPDGFHLQPNACLRMVDAIKYLIQTES